MRANTGIFSKFLPPTLVKRSSDYYPISIQTSIRLLSDYYPTIIRLLSDYIRLADCEAYVAEACPPYANMRFPQRFVLHMFDLWLMLFFCLFFRKFQNSTFCFSYMFDLFVWTMCGLFSWDVFVCAWNAFVCGWLRKICDLFWLVWSMCVVFLKCVCVVRARLVSKVNVLFCT